eukprot:8835797-Ditylum_brightwellii.AAC.1
MVQEVGVTVEDFFTLEERRAISNSTWDPVTNEVVFFEDELMQDVMDDGDQPTWIRNNLPPELTNCHSNIPIATAVPMETTNPQTTNIPLI